MTEMLTDGPDEGHEGEGRDCRGVAHEEALQRAQQAQALCRGEQLELLQLRATSRPSVAVETSILLREI